MNCKFYKSPYRGVSPLSKRNVENLVDRSFEMCSSNSYTATKNWIIL